MKAWVCIIHNNEGMGATIHRTEQDAVDNLHSYVDEWWEKERDLEGQPQPTDQREAIDLYFECVEHEWYEIKVVDLPEGIADKTPVLAKVERLSESFDLAASLACAMGPATYTAAQLQRITNNLNEIKQMLGGE